MQTSANNADTGRSTVSSQSTNATTGRNRQRCCGDRIPFPSIKSSSHSTRRATSSLILFSLLLWNPSPSMRFASSLLFVPPQNGRCLPQHQNHRNYHLFRPTRHHHRQNNDYSTVIIETPSSFLLSFRTFLTAHQSVFDNDDNDNEINVPSTTSQKRRRKGLLSSAVVAEATTSNAAVELPTKRQSNSKHISASTKNNHGTRATMSTAVCIVPPHHAWDAIQRARHMARDASFYRWPPAIRLFHPFVPHKDVPNAAGRLASWIDRVCEEEEKEEWCDHAIETHVDDDEDKSNKYADRSSSLYLRPFEVTLDSILILPHWEILDARIEALEDGGSSGGGVEDGGGIGRHTRSRRGQEQQRRRRRHHHQQQKQEKLGDDNNDYYQGGIDDENADAATGGSQEMEYRQRKAESTRLIEDEERKGIARKKERERKRRMRLLGKEEDGNDFDDIDNTIVNNKFSPTTSSTSAGGDNNVDEGTKPKNVSSYNGPCVVYLSPDDASRHRLESLREKIRVELFPNYDDFSPGSSVSPYPECLPRPRSSGSGGGNGMMSQFRPLLPIGRFTTVEDAVAVAKFLQSTWDPLTFNVADVQFISRRADNDHDYYDPSNDGATPIDTSNARQTSGFIHSDSFSGAGFGRTSSMTSFTTTTSTSVNRMAITTSGEVEDISRQGIYGCDAMVMLSGEEPEEELMDSEASLAMMMNDDDDDDENASEIDYNKIFATAEREYRRMQTHETLSTKNSSPTINYLANDDSRGDESDEFTSDIEAWLDDDDESLEDKGATVVIGRAQFFMGANREFVGMPASSAIDSKDRIMGGGISAVVRRKGSVHRLAESWSAGDYGKKDSDRRA